IVLIPGKFSLGQQLDNARQLADAPGLYGMMIVIFVIGVLVYTFVFGFAERKIRKRYGLIDTAAACTPAVGGALRDELTLTLERRAVRVLRQLRERLRDLGHGRPVLLRVRRQRVEVEVVEPRRVL